MQTLFDRESYEDYVTPEYDATLKKLTEHSGQFSAGPVEGLSPEEIAPSLDDDHLELVVRILQPLPDDLVLRIAAHVLDDAPLIWLFAAGAAVVLITLISFGSVTGGKPGQVYTPPSFKDGKIEPGHID
mgnify:CR=1 FL=1